jgi:HD-GYP domain-containing protein (c-di-GMP phosphodiesterase class II)
VETLGEGLVRDSLRRTARLGGGEVGIWTAKGELLFATDEDAGEAGPTGQERPLLVGGLVLGFVTQVGSRVLDEDALELATRTVGERLSAETEKNELTGEILGKLQELSVLYDVAADMARARDLPEVASSALGHARTLLAPSWAGVVGYDADRSQARLLDSSPGFEGVPRGWRGVERAELTWKVMNEQQPLLLPSLSDEDRETLRREAGPVADDATSLLAVPMSSSHQPVGALLLVNHGSKPAFTSVDAKLASAMCWQAAVSAGHLRLYQETKEIFHSTVWALASAIDAKDAYTHGHSQRVAKYSAALGRAVGFDDHEIERLELAAVLHDVGKIGVPEVILNKEGRLTPAEMSVMRSHPEKGAQILGSIRAMRDVVPGVLHHHERWDGLGYPDGLKGDNIPLNGRIILIADTFDAMTSTRPYREGLPLEVAIDELRRCSGTQFDGRLAQEFIRLFEEGGQRLEKGARPELDALETGEER